jgi:hypothetical protein
METRRTFLRRAVYIAPLIMTVAVRPSHACTGYQRPSASGGGAGSSWDWRIRPRGGRRRPRRR